MADDLQFKVSINDEASAKLAEIAKAFDALNRSANATPGGGDGARNLIGTFTELNSLLELVKKGFSALATAVALPVNALTGLVGVATDLVDVYDKQFTAETKLATSLRLKGQYTKEATDDLRAYASSLQDVTRYGDEAIIEVESLIGTFTGFGNTIKPATKVALDLSAALGLPLPNAARLVAQAMTRGTLELRGMTLELTKATDPTQRMTEAVKALEDRFGGMAEALARGGSGPIQQLANIFGDVQEEIGKAISRSSEFQAFIEVAKRTLGNLKDFVIANAATIGSLFGSAFSSLIEVVAGFGNAAIDVFRNIGGAAIALVDALSKIPGLGIETAFEKSSRELAAFEEEVRSSGDALGAVESRIRSLGSVDLGSRSLRSFIDDESLRDLQLGERLLAEFGKSVDPDAPAIDFLKAVSETSAKAASRLFDLKEQTAELAKDPFGGAGLSKSINEFADNVRKIGEAFPSDKFSPRVLIEEYRRLVREIGDLGPAAESSADQVNSALGGIAGDGARSAEQAIERLKSAQASLASKAGINAKNFLLGVEPDPRLAQELLEIAGVMEDVRVAVEDFGDAAGGVDVARVKFEQLLADGKIGIETFNELIAAIGAVPGASDSARASLVIGAGAAEELAQAILATQDAALDIPPALDGISAPIEEVNAAARQLLESVDGLSGGFDDSGRASDAVEQSIKSVVPQIREARQEAQQFGDALRNAAGGRSQIGITVTQDSSGGDGASAIAPQIAQALSSAANAMAAAIESAAAALEDAAGGIKGSAQAVSDNAADAAAAAVDLSGAADDISVAVESIRTPAALLASAGAAGLSAANQMSSAARDLQSAAIRLQNISFSSGNKASGGIMIHESTVTVADVGPELIAPRTPRGRALAREFFGDDLGGGTRVNLELNNVALDARAADVVAQRLQARMAAAVLAGVRRG